jgi:hypothetical protein
MSIAAERQRAAASGRFAYLMGLYTENYWRLVRLFGPERLAPGVFRSSVDDGLDVELALIERHPYTLDLSLSYLFHDEVTGRPDPSARVRVYRDARMAEVTACYIGTRLEDVLGRCAAPRTVFEHRLRMNSFFDKWLEYLAERGHSRFTLHAREAAAEAR